MNELLSWGLAVGAVIALIALGFNALQVVTSSDEFWIAKGWFLFAAIVALARLIYWGIKTTHGAALRFFVCAVTCGLVIAFAVEAIRYVNRKHDSWSKSNEVLNVSGQSEARLQTSAKEETASAPKPNLVARCTGYVDAHLSYGRIVEGIQPNTSRNVYPRMQVARSGFEKMTTIFLEICNEFSTSRQVGNVENLVAQIIYINPDDDDIQVNRGAWLTGSNRVDIPVNDAKRLIIAVVAETHKPYVFIPTRPYSKNTKLNAIISKLEDEMYGVEVRLISEAKGITFCTFDLTLTIHRGPEFFAGLTLMGQQIKRRLEAYNDEHS